jgi:ketosteroid isomerase-like protein
VTEANVDTLRRGYEALNRGDLTEVMALIDEELVWDGGDLSPDGQSPTPGRASFEAFVRSWIAAFDDFRVEPREVIEQEPFLLALVRQSGRGRASGAPDRDRDRAPVDDRGGPCHPPRIPSHSRRRSGRDAEAPRAPAV